MASIQKTILIILDGWGYASAWGGNAVEMAETPNMDIYWRKYPHTVLKAAEEAVGLPYHEPGNSEVGHLNLGCGQVVQQNLPAISKEIETGAFFKNQVLLDAMGHVRDNKSNLHLIGLLSDGGVHSHINHLFALMDLAKKENIKNVFIHVITDGRDTNPMNALSYLSRLEDKIKSIGLGKIETIMGRYYAMDRDNRWDRVQRAYDCLTVGAGERTDSGEKVISASYRNGLYDEFIIPHVVSNDNNFTTVSDNDSVIFFNFRADRTKELTWAFVKPKFNGFSRKKFLKNLYFATFAFHEEYEEKLNANVVFKPSTISFPLARIISEAGLKQLHIGETEKYAHVTFFFNGGQNQPYKNEDDQLMPSPKVATYDLKPDMSANHITEEVLAKMAYYSFIVINFANADMVGHTGNLKAAIKACEAVDNCLGKIVKEALSNGFCVVITADHGNAEQMINPNTGGPDTEHTINPVPFIVISEDPRFQNALRLDGSHGLILSDVSPTILKIMNLQKPTEMTGESLII